MAGERSDYGLHEREHLVLTTAFTKVLTTAFMKGNTCQILAGERSDHDLHGRE